VQIEMNEFEQQLETAIPRLRRYARALTRNAAAADDLVQNSLVRALEKQHLWQPGTNLRAWLFTILHNQHVNDVRRAQRNNELDAIDQEEPAWKIEPVVDGSLELRDLERALGMLREEQRAVVLLVGLEGLQYEEIADVLGAPIGTVRSRLSRARSTLRLLMDGGRRASSCGTDTRADLESRQYLTPYCRSAA
jgi:RNA polymerase sigma-70 factor (ECF subfamily)